MTSAFLLERWALAKMPVLAILERGRALKLSEDKARAQAAYRDFRDIPILKQANAEFASLHSGNSLLNPLPRSDARCRCSRGALRSASGMASTNVPAAHRSWIFSARGRSISEHVREWHCSCSGYYG